MGVHKRLGGVHTKGKRRNGEENVGQTSEGFFRDSVSSGEAPRNAGILQLALRGAWIRGSYFPIFLL